ncbi:MAG: choice-of-anchor D domain-containing protein [Acidimicrobiales bacterium]
MLAALATIVALLVTAEVSTPSPAAAATSSLNSGNFKVVDDGTGAPIDQFRFVVNLDNTGTTSQRTPDGPCSPGDSGYPDSCPWTSNGTPSSSPVVTTGDQSDLDGAGFTLPVGRYLISVLADGYELDGLHVTVPFDGTLTLPMIATPLKAATIQAAVFEDISPVNGAPDLPAEHGLAGFRAGLLDYLGDISTDVFGNPLCTVYEFTGSSYFDPARVDNIDAIRDPGGNCFSYCYVVDNGIDIGITEPNSSGRCPTVDPAAAASGLTYTTTFPPAPGTYTNSVPTTAAIEGKVKIPNLGPNRYAMTLTAPDGTTWAQTTTLEGNHDWDAWVMEGQTGLDTEFVVAGEPFPSIIFGYTPASQNNLTGSGATISGVVEAMKVYVPTIGGTTVPAGQIWGGLNGAKIDKPIDQPWVSLTDLDNGDTMVWVDRGNADGTFSIPNVPNGNYMLTWWDEPQNYILDWQNVTIVDGQSVDMGILPLTGWWTTYEGYVFNDLNRNGRKDAGEPGVPNYTLTMRKRENSLMDRGTTAVSTDANGYYSFESAYPMTQWLVMEAYNDLYYTTGITYQADNQPQPTTVLGAGVDVSTLPVIGLSGRIDWGVHSYDARGTTNGLDPRNGGIVGTVSYDTTRNELDPRYAAVEDWQPGVSGLVVDLYEPTACPLDDNGDPLTPGTDGYLPCDASGMYALAADGSYLTGQKLNTYVTETWQRPGLNDDGECIPRDVDGNELTYPDKQQITDSHTDCLEAPLMGVQFQKGFSTVDGNYGFGDGCFAPNHLDPDAPADTPVCLDPTGVDVGFDDLPGGADYLVKVNVPEDTVQNDGRSIYQFTREEDINIANGDQIVPQIPPPACAGALHTVDVSGGATTDGYLEKVGDGANGLPVGVTVPASTPTDNPTFTADVGGSPYEGLARPLCDMKLVPLANGRSIVPTFNVFTDVPVAGRFWGLVVNDLGFSTDPHQINYGEKAGVPFAPVGIYDQNNRLVYTTESDYSGLFDVLMPSTNRINCPTPSGVCANLFRFVGNDPGVPGRLNLNYNPRYRTIAADFETFPGLIVPADLAPTQVGVQVQLPGGQVAPLACSPDADQPQLYSIDKPYLGLNETHTFTLQGANFGADTGKVLLDETAEMTVASWSNSEITFTVPSGNAGVHQLSVQRADNEKSTTAGLSLHVFGSSLPAFPANGVLDDFNRSNRTNLGPWGTSGSGFAIDNQQLRARTGNGTGTAVWQGQQSQFGASQEAFVNLAAISTLNGGAQQGLLLKVSGNTNLTNSNSRYVSIAVTAAGDVVLQYKTGNSAAAAPQTIGSFGTSPGVLGARVLSDGTVAVYKDGALLVSVATNDAVGALTGRIGVRAVNTGSNSGNPGNTNVGARFDDFGGGNVTTSTYSPTVYEVGPGKTYAPANTLPATANHAIQDAIDDAQQQPGNALVVVYPNNPTSDPRINPRGAYYENLILNAPISLQGVGPGSPDGSVKGSIIDGGGFGGDSPVATDWYTTLNGLTWAGNQNVNDGAIISVFAPDTGPRAFSDTRRAAIDGFDLRGGDQFGFPNNINVIGGGTTGLPANVQTQGGAVFANGYARYLQITNNTVQNNGGAYGTIRIGTPDLTGPDANANNDHIRIANNRIVANAGTNLAGAIGLFEGSDNYTVSGNDICGNFSAEYGGALTVYGLSGGSNSIDHNRIWFNNSYDEAGGVMIAGELPASPTSLSPGSGPVNIHHNLIQENLGNDDGGGLRFLMSGNFPMEVFDNIIVNNVTTHEGGGVSIDGAPDVRFVNNTVMGNLATATAATSDGQPAAAGLSFTRNSDPLRQSLPGNPDTSPPVLRNNVFWDNRTGTKQGPGQAGPLVTGLGQTQSGDTVIDTWQIGSIDGAAPAEPADSVIQSDPNHAGSYTDSASNVHADPLVIEAYATKVSFDAWRTNPNFVGALLATLSPAATRQGDYHLQGGSPAIDLGTAPAPTTDYDDAPRDASPDAGADERAAVVTGSALLAPTSVDFGPVYLGATSAAQTVTLTNNATGALDGITVAIADGFGRSGGTCGTTLGAGESCTIGVTFSPTASGPATATLAVSANVPITGSPVTLTGTGAAVPDPAVLDTFDRTNANTLGGDWNQLVVLNNAGIRVNRNRAFCANSGAASLLCTSAVGANAYWTASYGPNQAAAFTFANSTVNNNWLWLKAGGTQLLGTYLDGIRVSYASGQVTVVSVSGGAATTVGTFSAGFANGDRLLAAADANGTVTVWKVSGTTTTFVGSAATPNTGGGAIGMHLARGARVDDFAGGDL